LDLSRIEGPVQVSDLRFQKEEIVRTGLERTGVPRLFKDRYLCCCGNKPERNLELILNSSQSHSDLFRIFCSIAKDFNLTFSRSTWQLMTPTATNSLELFASILRTVRRRSQEFLVN